MSFSDDLIAIAREAADTKIAADDAATIKTIAMYLRFEDAKTIFNRFENTDNGIDLENKETVRHEAAKVILATLKKLHKEADGKIKIIVQHNNCKGESTIDIRDAALMRTYSDAEIRSRAAAGTFENPVDHLSLRLTIGKDGVKLSNYDKRADKPPQRASVVTQWLNDVMVNVSSDPAALVGGKYDVFAKPVASPSTESNLRPAMEALARHIGTHFMAHKIA